MEQKDGNEETSPKLDEGNDTSESVEYDDGGDAISPPNPQAGSTQEESVTNQGGIVIIDASSPNVGSAEGEPSVSVEGGSSSSNTDAAQTNDVASSEGGGDNKNTDGVVAAENEQSMADPAQEDATKNGIIENCFSLNITVMCYPKRITWNKQGV